MPRTSLGKRRMCSGIFFPTKNSQHSSEKLLQLCSNKLYVPTLNREWTSSRKVWNKASSTCVSPMRIISFGVPNCVCFGIPTCIPWPNQYSFPWTWIDVCHTPSISLSKRRWSTSCLERVDAKPPLHAKQKKKKKRNVASVHTDKTCRNSTTTLKKG